MKLTWAETAAAITGGLILVAFGAMAHIWATIAVGVAVVVGAVWLKLRSHH